MELFATVPVTVTVCARVGSVPRLLGVTVSIVTARGSDVTCDRVMATFGNGRTREIFSGELPRGQTITVDLPGRERSVDRVDFDCHPTDRWRARVDIATNDTGYGYPGERFGFNYRDRPPYMR